VHLEFAHVVDVGAIEDENALGSCLAFLDLFGWYVDPGGEERGSE
jgi:hypothetical protein